MKITSETTSETTSEDTVEEIKPSLPGKQSRQRNNGKPKPRGAKERYTPLALAKLAEKYFAQCENTIIGTNEKTGIKIHKPKLKSGLAKFLKVGPEYFFHHKKKEEYAEVMSYIDSETMNSIEEGILVGTYNPAAGIFNLKNHHGQSDKAEVKSDIDTTIKITFGD